MKVHVDIKYGPAIHQPGFKPRGDLPGVSEHAQIRARQRLARYPTWEEWLTLVRDILDRRAVLMQANERVGGRRETWLCLVAGVPMRVIWAPETAMLITVVAPRQKALQHRLKHNDATKHGITRAEPRRGYDIDQDWADTP